MHHLTMKRLLLVVLAAGLTLMGCDQSDYDADYDIPDGQEEGFVQVSSPDTVAIFKSSQTDIVVESPDAAIRQEGYMASFEVSSENGEAILGEDYTIAEVSERDSSQVVNTVEVDLDELDDFLSDFNDNDDPSDGAVVLDTLDADGPDPIAQVELTTYSYAIYEVTFDEDNGTGTIEVNFDDLGLQAGNTIDDALVTVQGLQNGDADEPLSFTFTLTDAETTSGEPLPVGRPPNGFSSSKVILVGQADVSTRSQDAPNSATISQLAFGEVEVGEDSLRTFFVYNGGDVPSVVSNFQITGADADAFEIVEAPGSSATVEPGNEDSIPVTVAFSPESVDDLTATLSFQIANDFDQRSTEIVLFGTGVE